VCACYRLLCIVCYSRDLCCYILLILYVPCDVRFDVASSLVQVLVRFSVCAGGVVLIFIAWRHKTLCITTKLCHTKLLVTSTFFCNNR
jgi:hypothetical protein